MYSMAARPKGSNCGELGGGTGPVTGGVGAVGGCGVVGGGGGGGGKGAAASRACPKRVPVRRGGVRKARYRSLVGWACSSAS